LHPRVKLRAIPLVLIRQLPPAPRGTRYIYVDDQVLLINVNTRLILDFINISVSKPAPRTVERMPSYEEQHPSQTHQPPSHAQAHEVAQGKPFTDDEHPSSQGQGHRMNKGKPDMGDDHPSQHAKNDRGHGQQADRGKPLWGNDSPSSQGQNHRMNRGKSDQGQDHSSSQGQGNRGHQKGPIQEEDFSSAHAKMDKGNRGGSPEDKGRPSAQAKVDKGHQGGPPKRHDRPSKGKGKPAMDSPMADDAGSHQMDARGKPDRGGHKGKGKPAMDSPMASDAESHQMDARGKPDKEKSKGRGKQKDTLADSSMQEESSVQSSSHSKNKGKRSKQDRDSARGPSGQKDREQFQPDSTPEENIQVAKVERGRDKGKSKGPGKANKMERGKREQQTDLTAEPTPQGPAPSMAPPEPTITASIAPAVFDNNQRNIIQSYYHNSGSKKSGKGRGKKSRGSKRNKTSSVAKNDILTQPTEPLPRSLESQLPPAPPNSKRVLYNQQVLLIEKGTNKVLDVINVNN